jgi:peptide/nickel transport system permease protein
MTKYLLRRLLLLIPTLIGMSMLIFLMVRLLPGDIVDSMVGMDPQVTQEQRAELRHRFGLDAPIPVQYVRWVDDILHGNLGKSYRTLEPITAQLIRSLPITVELAIVSILMSVLVAIPLGVISAVKQNSIVDLLAHVGGLVGLSLPNFWLATIFLLITSLAFHWVPAVMWVSPLEDLPANLLQMALPALSLAVPLMAIEMRMARASMLEVLRQDYIRTARSKGLREGRVMFQHALRNALIPVVTVVGLQIGSLMGGSVIIEQIYGLPGVGWSMLQGVYNRDYPVIQVTTLFLATVFVLMNLIVDVTYAYLDPRIKYT